jgi:cytochrome c oxidase assembly protein subunit 15
MFPAEKTRTNWVQYYAGLTALATFALLAVGGLVTSHGVGMAVPDWPTTYGYNLFFFPVSKWVGGIFYEHTHRLVATFVGVLVVGLTRWLGGRPSRLPLALVGGSELLFGFLLLRLDPKWSGAGHFLSGIGGVVLLGALVWVRNSPAEPPLPFWGWLAFVLVQFQGLLGGLRVVLFKDEIGIFHGALAQLFFGLTCAIALFSSRWWRDRAASILALPAGRFRSIWRRATALILVQLLLGATMRHQHAGLAIPDFPLAYGRIWPAMDPTAIAQYNQQRIEIVSLNPITAFQIALQMAHRFCALLICCTVAFAAWRTTRELGRKNSLTRITFFWMTLILTQVVLGAATIWSNKAADIATGHVLIGALSLATGLILCIISSRTRVCSRDASKAAELLTRVSSAQQPAAPRA